MATASKGARRPAPGPALCLVLGLCSTRGLGAAEQPKTSVEPPPAASVPPAAVPCPDGVRFLPGSIRADELKAPGLAAAQPEPGDRPLP